MQNQRKAVKQDKIMMCMCLTFCDPIDYTPSASSLHGIFKARILEWIAISFSRGSSQPRDQTKPVPLASPALAGGFFTFVPPGTPKKVKDFQFILKDYR